MKKIDEIQWARIREMYFIEKLSKSEIGRRLGIDRNTIAIYCKENIYPFKNNQTKKNSKLRQYKPKINELLKNYPNLSAVRIFEEITKDGYDGKITILRDYLRRIRAPKKEAFVRIETEPGEQTQVDWGNFGKIKYKEYERNLSCFAMVLGYSRLMYIEWCVSEKLEDFIRCHINAFEYFEGHTLEILYDNLKSVVLYRYGKYIYFNPKFMRFAGSFPFSVKLCAKAKANQKGKVESGIKYIRNNFFAGRIFKDFEDLTSQSKEWLEKTANVRIHGTTHERPIDRHLKEKDKLKPLPLIPYDCDIVEIVRSSKDARIKFDCNYYSIPYYHILKTLVVKASPVEVKIYNKDKLIAVHKRCYEKYKAIENPSHIKGLLDIKQRAKEEKQKDEFLSLSELAEKYFAGLVSKTPNVNFHIKKILDLRHKYGKAEILGAIEKAMKYQAYGSEYIKNIIITRRIENGEEIGGMRLVFPKKPELEDIYIGEVDLSKYDKLTEENGGKNYEQKNE